MTRRYAAWGKALLLTLSLGLTGAGVQAQSVTTPPGWKAQNQSGATMLTPGNLPAGKAVTMLVFPPQPLNGQNLKTWAENIFKQGAAQYGKALQPGQTTYSDPTWTYAQLVEVGGKPFSLNFFVFPAGTGKAQLVSLLMTSDKALSDQYTPAVAGVLVGLIKNGAPATATTSPATQGATGSTALADDYELPRGSRVGGSLVFGTYVCSRAKNNEAAKPTGSFNIYPKNEYRRVYSDKAPTYEMDFGHRENASYYKYDPKTGLLDLYDDDDFSNSEFRMERGRFGIFYTDPAGRPVLYAEDDYGLGIYITTCVYAGANKFPAPSQVKAEYEKKKAAEDAARAEANRFKWVTAPGKGVQLNQIQTLIYDGPGQHRDVSSSGKDPKIVLLLKDGWAYTGLRVTPHDLDVKKSRQNEPDKWFKWRQQGGKYQLFDRLKNTWTGIAGSPVNALKNGEKLNSSFTHNSFSNTSSGTSYSESTISFKTDGKFEESGVSKSASSISQSLYLGSTSVSSSTSSKNGCFTSAQSSAGYTPLSTATVNSGASQQRDCGSDNAGKYTVNGYTLELRYDSGRVTRTFLYFRDAAKKQLGIGYSIYGPPK